MDCVMLSLKSLREESLKLAKTIEKDYTPDIVIYIARGGYLIGKEISDYFNVPCVGIHAERRGGGVKEIISPVLRIIPLFIRRMLREFELKSNVHKVEKKRNIFWDQKNLSIVKNNGKIKNILLVDDSVDTGYSMLQVKDKIYGDLGAVVIRTAAINVWSKSAKVCETNYCNYKNFIIMTPMSKDSKEYPEFEKLYNNRKIL
jgi:hypoxanthine phosphoribosyltransferase